ncbi:MAG: alpha-glucuronidase family glycosyl hydrolase, partial [Novosphingobium sp.]
MNNARPRWIQAGLAFSALLVAAATALPARASDGYDLWLGPQGSPAAAAKVEALGTSRTLAIAAEELRKGLPQAATPVLLARAGEPTLAPLKLATGQLGNEGYLVRSVTLSGRRLTVVTGNTDVAVLYGAFALLRHARAGGDTAKLALASTPRIPLRVLDHWDNLDGSVERGYAGQS